MLAVYYAGAYCRGMENETILTARSVCDYNCIFKATLIKRTKKTATVKAMNIVRRCKIHINSEGEEYIYALGKYSMSPIFKL